MFDSQRQLDREALIGQVGQELAELQASHDDSDRALARHLGIGRTDLRCLDLITRHGPCSAGQLARALGLTPGSVTALLDRLDRLGYAQRLPDPTHGKRVLVAPTPRLVEIITPLISERIDRDRAQLASYDPGQLTLIRDFLRATRRSHQQFTENLHPS